MGLLPRITYLGHSTVLVEQGGRRVLTDPILRTRVTFLGRVAPAPANGLAPAPSGGPLDAVLISHLHHDHTDVPSLRLLPRDVPLLVPLGSRAFFARLGFTDIELMPVGRTWSAAARRWSGRAADHGHARPCTWATGCRSARVRTRSASWWRSGPGRGCLQRLLRRGHRPVRRDGRPAPRPRRRADAGLGLGAEPGPGSHGPPAGGEALALLRPGTPCRSTGARCSRSGCVTWPRAGPGRPARATARVRGRRAPDPTRVPRGPRRAGPGRALRAVMPLGCTREDLRWLSCPHEPPP